MTMIDGIFQIGDPLAAITRSAASKLFADVLKGGKACMIM